MKEKKKYTNFETLAIRTQTERGNEREHSTPIFPTSGFVFDDAEQMRSLFAGETQGNIYSRYSNPNCTEFEAKIALMEKFPRALSSASGMASIFSTFMALLKQGDHLLSSKAIFGSSIQIINNFLPNYGISNSYINPTDIDSWDDFIKPETKMIFIETPSNPGLEIIDLALAGKFAKKHNLIFVVDNCFATPYLQTPADFGADIVTHSATKFMDGQGRVGGGVIAMKEEFYDKVKSFQRQTGPSLSPFNAWVLSKSLETLALRMDKHCANALFLAKEMSKCNELNWVKYPFLESHPQYEIAKKQMLLGGGLFSFELKGGVERGVKFLNSLELLSLSANLGDTRTIVTHPASTTHSKLSPQEKADVGITQGMVRVSVGLEHPEDILEDLLQAVDKSK